MVGRSPGQHGLVVVIKSPRRCAKLASVLAASQIQSVWRIECVTVSAEDVLAKPTIDDSRSQQDHNMDRKSESYGFDFYSTRTLCDT